MDMGSSSSSESLNGLKFGRKIYFEDSSSSSAPVQPKKVRSGLVPAGQPPRCQVEGCSLDLTDAKTYYSRHKVCGAHSKFPKVVVNGIEQRFCQQCSRFHQLEEFDQEKRSCRRRLAGHNERRRKPPPGSLLSQTYDSGSSGGSFQVDFSAYPRVAGDEWPGRNLPPWQGCGSDHVPHHPPPSDLYIQTGHHLGVVMHSPPDMSVAAADSSCALSLLSYQPWGPRPGGEHHHPAPGGSWGVKPEGAGPNQPLSGDHIQSSSSHLGGGRRPYMDPANSRGGYDDSAANLHHHHHMNWSL